MGPPQSLIALAVLAFALGCDSAAAPVVVAPPVAPTATQQAEIQADLAALAPPQLPDPPPASETPAGTAPTVAGTDTPSTPAAPGSPSNPASDKPADSTPPPPTTADTPKNTPPAEVATAATPRVRPSVIPAGPAVNPLPGGVRVLIPTKTFRPEGRERALRVVFDDLDLLKVINMEPVTPDAVGLMPDWLRILNGQTIRIRGFMYPPSFPDGITRFLLARDNQICCFGRNPKPYDIVAVTMKADVSTHYIENRPFDVIGTFRIEEQPFEDIETFSLYRLDDAIVIER